MAKKKNRKDEDSGEEDAGLMSNEAASASTAPTAARGKKKNKKGKRGGDWSDDDAPPAVVEDVTAASKKKGKKGKRGAAQSDDEGESTQAAEGADAAPGVPRKSKAKGKKKGKSNNRGGFSSDDDAPDFPKPGNEPAAPPAAAAHSKKKRKGKRDAPAHDSEGVGGPLDVRAAQVVSAKPHPEGAPLLVLAVDEGTDVIQVVTSVLDVRVGDMVAFAGVGATLPGADLTVSSRTLRGIQSDGVLCSEADLGWAPADDAPQLASLPPRFSMGEKLPAVRPPDLLRSTSPGSGGAAEALLSDDDPEAAAMVEEATPQAVSGPGAAASGFGALLGDGEDEDEEAEGEEQEDERGNQAKDAASAFAALGVDDDEDSEAASQISSPPPTRAADAASAFAALGLDDEDSESGSETGDEERPAAGPSGAASAFAALGGEEESSSEDEAPPPAATAASAFAALGGEGSSSSEEDDAGPALAAAPTPPQGAASSAFAALGGDSESEEEVEEQTEEEEREEAAAQPPPPKTPVVDAGRGVAGKGGKKKGGGGAAEDDIDALLAGIEGGGAGPGPNEGAEPEATPGKPLTAAQKKKLKKQRQKQGKQAEEEDLDALLADIDGPAAKAAAPVEEEPAGQGGGDAAPATEADAAEGDAEDGEDGEADGGEEGGGALTAAQKKKLKKKQKAKEKKAAGDDAKAKPKKMSAAVARIQAEVERKQRAQEEAERAAAEAAAAEAERIRMEEEEEAQREAAAEKRRAERAAKREQARKEGKPLTAKQKADARKMEAAREALLAQAAAQGIVAPSGAEGSRKRATYGKKKSKKELAEEEEARKAAAEEERLQAIDRERAAKAAEREAQLKAEAEAKAAEEAAADDWEDVADDWEAAAEEAAATPSPAPVDADAQSAGAGSQEESSSDSESGSESDSDSESGSSSDSGSDSSSEYSTSSEDSEDARLQRVEDVKKRMFERRKAAMAEGDQDDLRSPICCILGHVDTGKTKILDNVRRTNVQDGEAGGITQQIGATYIPGSAVEARTEELRRGREFRLSLPGLLVIDTPGHESFTNLRSRGSSLCDMAVLVVDIMHGMEQQTVESINLIKMRKTPFIVALNKVDRMFEWKQTPDAPIRDSLKRQKPHVKREFEQRCKDAVLMLNEQGLNVALYWDNPDPRKYINIVPTSAISGEGIPDLLQLVVKLTQTMMRDRMVFVSELQATVLEVKKIDGIGTTIDVVLVNGFLHEGDTIVVCGLQGAIVTQIRSLLTPQPMKELRIKGSYVHHKDVKAAQGIKIAAPGLEEAVAGTQLYLCGPDDDLEALKDLAQEDMTDVFDRVDSSGEGVCVQASTLGSLEALLEFLGSDAVRIPVSAIRIGPVSRRDVMRANVMAEKGCKRYAVILAFDVPVNAEAAALAKDTGIQIFTADIIYHLFDRFTAYMETCKREEQEAAKDDAVFPCVLEIIPSAVFNTKNPIVLGVEIKEGVAKVGTPLVVPSKGGVSIGRIASMEKDHKGVDRAKRGDSVAMKIEAHHAGEDSVLFGRHFDASDALVSKISRKSIDLLKTHFRNEMTREDWQLVVRLKSVFHIV